MKWRRTRKDVTSSGTTIRYESDETSLIIESQKKHIPHSGREGFWDHTMFYVVDRDRCLAREFYSLADAKEFAEKVEGGLQW